MLSSSSTQYSHFYHHPNHHPLSQRVGSEQPGQFPAGLPRLLCTAEVGVPLDVDEGAFNAFNAKTSKVAFFSSILLYDEGLRLVSNFTNYFFQQRTTGCPIPSWRQWRRCTTWTTFQMLRWSSNGSDLVWRPSGRRW